MDNLNGTGSGDEFTERENGDFFLVAGVTVWNDAAVDRLWGGLGRDWFFFDASKDRLLGSVTDEEFDLF